MADARVTGAIGGALGGAAKGSAFGPIGTVAGAIIGGGLGALGGGGADEAKELAEAQAELIELETGENIRRINRAKDITVGTARAAQGASNLQSKYSPASYVENLESSFISDVAFTHLAGRERAKAARLGGDIRADAIEMQGYQDLIGGLFEAGATFGPGIFGKEKAFDENSWLKPITTGDDPYNIGWSSLGKTT